MPDTSTNDTKKTNMSKKDLLHNLIWPAVAGNVAWAFFTVLITEVLVAKVHIGPMIFGRLTALLFLSIYLIIVYIRSEAGTGHFFDILHAISIILCAIAFQSIVSAAWMSPFLIALFIIAAIGHWTGRWIPSSVKTKKGLKKILVGLINFSGAVLCFFLPNFIDNSDYFNLSISMGFVFLLWLIFRNRIYCEWK